LIKNGPFLIRNALFLFRNESFLIRNTEFQTLKRIFLVVSTLFLGKKTAKEKRLWQQVAEIGSPETGKDNSIWQKYGIPSFKAGAEHGEYPRRP
jgi:hypothetical protein